MIPFKHESKFYNMNEKEEMNPQTTKQNKT